MECKRNSSKSMCAILTIAGMSLLGQSSVSGAADAVRGQSLAEKWCNACHSIGTDMPRQEDAGPLFSELAGKPGPDLILAIDARHDFMPNFPSLDDTDKKDIVAYIQTVE